MCDKSPLLYNTLKFPYDKLTKAIFWLQRLFRNDKSP